jgi:hypothetical protein
MKDSILSFVLRHSSITVLDKHSYLLFTMHLMSIIYKIFNIRMKIDAYIYVIDILFVYCLLYCAAADGMQCFWTIFIFIKIR